MTKREVKDKKRNAAETACLVFIDTVVTDVTRQDVEEWSDIELYEYLIVNGFVWDGLAWSKNYYDSAYEASRHL